jgi:formiminotetrahydrofolate cyclodeaminase
MQIDDEFLVKLASSSPTPGGGGASAYAGALAAAVGSMAVAISQRHGDDDEMRMCAETLQGCRQRLVQLVDDDAKAFGALSQAWKYHRDTAAHKRAYQRNMEKTLVEAIEVPMGIMRVCGKVIETDEILVEKVPRLLMADVGASAVLAQGAMDAAALNVFVNAASMTDAGAARTYEAEAEDLMHNFSDRSGVVYDYVLHEVHSRKSGGA